MCNVSFNEVPKQKVNWNIKFLGILSIPDRTADSGNIE